MDVHLNDGVATQVVEETAALVIRLAVEHDRFVAADGECGVDLYQLAYRQMQTVIGVVAVRLTLGDGVVVGLGGTDTMPVERNLIRADNRRRIYRINMIDSQLQYVDTVAAEPVGTVVIVRTGRTIRRLVPYIALACVHVVNEDICIRFHDIQTQYYYAVAAAFFEGVFIDTCLGQEPVAEGVTAALADRFGHARLGDILHRQVQDILYAVVAVAVFFGLYIAVRLVELMVAPAVR